MNSKEFFAALESAGWTVAANPLPSQENKIKWYAYRKLVGASDCVFNDRSPSIVIEPHEFDLQGKTFRSAEIKVTGESRVGWIEFKVYGIKFEDVLTNADKYEAALRSAWEAVAFKGEL